MNNPQSIESGKGILKQNTEDALSSALKSKRKKLAETKRVGDGPQNEEDQALETEDL